MCGYVCIYVYSCSSLAETARALHATEWYESIYI